MRRLRSHGVIASGVAITAAALAAGAHAKAGAAAPSVHAHLDCAYSRVCPDLAGSASVFDSYVGHDEPAALFYSNTPGSGNRMQYAVTLPTDPPPSHPLTRSYQFELNAPLWFGMALCDTRSYPERVPVCTPDSDTNITSNLAMHPGTAYLELQLYPPGWIPWPAWQVAPGGVTCDPVRWCAAMNIFSLLEDPVRGTVINRACRSRIGLETAEFAFVTRDGVAQAPANPLDSTAATFTPDRTRDLFMASGDHLSVSLHDTAEGVQANIHDLSSGESGSMTASPANGFAQFSYAPRGTTCAAIPYAFHPMYSTSSPATRVIWAAHSYNVAFAAELGHFQLCTGTAVPATAFGVDGAGAPVPCPAANTEGFGGDRQPAGEGEDLYCFPASEALRDRVQGCTGSNIGFDGPSYEPLWPDGDTAHHPTPFTVTSPRSGPRYDQRYAQAAFETNLPSNEFLCDILTGSGCTLIPMADDRAPASFYPFFTTTRAGGSCAWQLGTDTPATTDDFGGNAQYGSLLPLPYLANGGHGSTLTLINDFRGDIPNPC